MPFASPISWKTATTFALLMAAVLPGTAQTPSHRVVALRTGESSLLSLPGNPTTGYVWSLASPLPQDAPVSVELTLLEPGEQTEETPRCGAPQRTQVTLRALRPGSCSVTLIYARPWEKDRPAAQELTLDISVK